MFQSNNKLNIEGVIGYKNGDKWKELVSGLFVISVWPELLKYPEIYNSLEIYSRDEPHSSQKHIVCFNLMASDKENSY